MNAIDCKAAREQMLEAELDELRAIAATPLSAHIAACSECAMVAGRLLRGYERLDAGLGRLEHRRTSHWRRWAALPLAAAAVLALLVAQRIDEPVPTNSQLVALMFREQPVVTPPAGKQAIIVENKDLTVVWLY